MKRADQAPKKRTESVEHELAMARRECERAAGDAEDRKVQLSVLVETVETLQAGTPGKNTMSACCLCVQLYLMCTIRVRAQSCNHLHNAMICAHGLQERSQLVCQLLNSGRFAHV